MQLGWPRLTFRHALMVVGALAAAGLFYLLFTRDAELRESIYLLQTKECQIAERRGLPAEACFRAVQDEWNKVLRWKSLEAAILTSGALAVGWSVAFLSVRLYRWLSVNVALRTSLAKRGKGVKRARRKRSSERKASRGSRR
jgi:hypothetical protein